MILSTKKIEKNDMYFDLFSKKLFTITIFKDKKSGISRFWGKLRD
ncbi:glucose-inhibited division protein A [Vibrio splendidus]|uniref:Glucose-inhibited division protein A n=1 Tax=Vibrio splendidus TaxID=29497 RepID=A0A2N7F970_VIBSP|nr:glucose-inhibited division protein A [Vibrio splendidus]PMI77961.1 glucose-inhibited division protein A [Vibrio splendidus]PMJ63618.1 glucose-inhibited division protein A [Vibrio splendidus]PMK55168.1 glucose-inhibited division protein A [Vibrio splendidus]